MIEALAEGAGAAEKLGAHDGTDVLAVSFSSNDYIGHAVGPDAPQVRDISIRTDRLLGKLLAFIDGQIAERNTLVVLTPDHGVLSIPEFNVHPTLPAAQFPQPPLPPPTQAPPPQ